MTASVPLAQAPEIAARRTWLAVLARAPVESLEAGVRRWAPQARYDFLRRPETGLVMLRGRIGGTGNPFNLGEASVTRCTVRSSDGLVGTGHVLGRDKRKAELVALLDALLQEPAYRALLEPELVTPLRHSQQRQREAAAAAAGTSTVEFFTSVRGE
jgi:alpha-D-ribose 1-methylphosphonate 5-triphosphate synthase subunit PhnG